ncbi:MAG: uroporphyrinogen decarboxylase [Deltaproteobacteria bacterium]|jgi:uroporphyrinogen decarboxylase|nr:uroporphyrinogen decarboxylase [Deltaproteobacteria bacterium]
MKKKMLEQTFRLERTARIPVGFWLHLIPEAETGDAVARPSLAEESISAHRSFIRTVRPDFVKTMSDGFFFYPSGGVPRERTGPSDLAAIGPSDPWIQGQVEVQRRVRETDPELPYFYNIFSPLTSFRFLAGRERLMGLLKDDPESLAAGLGRMGKGLAALAKAIVAEGGADGIYLSVQNPERELFGSDFYRRLISPAETAILDAARSAGGRSILHVCGYAGIRNRLEDFAAYPADAISYARAVEGVPFPAARAVFPGKALIAGFANTPGSVIHRGTRAEVEAETRAILKEAAGLPGIIVGADCTVPSDIDLERLGWVREAANPKAA